MCILALYEDELAYSAFVYKLLCFNEAGGTTADLTYHKHSARLTLDAHHLLTFLKIKCHWLLAQNVLACSEECSCHLQMHLVGSDDNHRIKCGIVYKLAVVGYGILAAYLILCRPQLLGCGIAYSIEISSLVC